MWRRYRFGHQWVNDYIARIEIAEDWERAKADEILGAQAMLAQEVSRTGSTVQRADEWRKDIAVYRGQLAAIEKEIARCERQMRRFQRIAIRPWEPLPSDLWSSPDAFPSTDVFVAPDAVP
jgi:hypothetical protein